MFDVNIISLSLSFSKKNTLIILVLIGMVYWAMFDEIGLTFGHVVWENDNAFSTLSIVSILTNTGNIFFLLTHKLTTEGCRYEKLVFISFNNKLTNYSKMYYKFEIRYIFHHPQSSYYFFFDISFPINMCKQIFMMKICRP